MGALTRRGSRRESTPAPDVAVTRARQSVLDVEGRLTVRASGAGGAGGAGTSVVNTLNVGPIGRFDLKDNKLIVTVSPSTPSRSSLPTAATAGRGTATTALLRACPTRARSSASPRWRSRTADETFYAGGTFAGVSVSSGDVLVMYTYAGDLNLDGLVDAADYGVIDNFVQSPVRRDTPTATSIMTASSMAGDYGIIDNTFQLQGPPIPVNGPQATAVIAVPEPAAVALLVASFGHLLRRHRRRWDAVTAPERPPPAIATHQRV
jgi:hypothetical protein